MNINYLGLGYNNRYERNKFIAEQFNEYLGNKILNIGGGGDRTLSKYLNDDQSYLEIDIDGNPDILINLEEQLPLPFDDNSFSTVICTDVLEHLDNLHDVLEEIIRVSSENIIISLPNSSRSAIKAYLLNKVYKNDNSNSRRNRQGKYMKYYGLPYLKPLDRHKWFFSYVDAEEFFYYITNKNNLKIKEIFGIGYYSNGIAGKIIRQLVGTILGTERRKNFFCSSIWCIIGKNHNV